MDVGTGYDWMRLNDMSRSFEERGVVRRKALKLSESSCLGGSFKGLYCGLDGAGPSVASISPLRRAVGAVYERQWFDTRKDGVMQSVGYEQTFLKPPAWPPRKKAGAV